MRTAPFKLLAILAVASVSAAGCGDDDKPAGDTSTDTTTPDTTTPDTTTPDTTTPDTTPVDTTTPDTTPDTTPTCGLRECGTFGNLNCGDCSDKPGTECNDNGRCVVPGQPLGAFCGITSTCTESSANFPACLDEQCDTNYCMSNTAGGYYTFAIFRDWGNIFANSYCTASCQIYKDTNNDGVNDADAQDDCNPPDIVDGPVGNSMRCVNFAPIDGNPVGLCVPGSDFKRCDEPSDCTTPGESCELTSVLGLLEGRCVANYKSGSWGEAVGIGEACNADPEAGDVTICQAGYCEFYGCAPNCGQNDDCMTASAGACQAGKCEGKPGKECANDADCSSFECGEIQLTETESFGRCAPKSCVDEDDCGGGFSCSWGWNGSVGNPGPDNNCVGQVAGGEDLGEACDPDPTDNDVVNGGAVCKTDLCLGGKCSAVCSEDAQCGQDGVCAAYEFSDAMIGCDVDEDCGAGNACTGTDGACYDPNTLQYIRGEEDTFVLSLQFCANFEGATGSCLGAADCGASESCELYAKASDDPDAPQTLQGMCVPAQGAGDLGDECTDFSDCKSGFCLPVTETFSFCTEPCTASADCGSFNIGEDPVNGYCNSYLYSFAGDLDNFENFLYVGLCIFDFGSTADCSGDFACDAATEACFPNVVAGADPTKPAVTENLCFQVWEAEADRGTKQLGEACNPDAEIPECASGLCTTEVGDDTQGYCSAMCTKGGSECGTGDLACTELIRNPRGGAYVGNTGAINLCLKSQVCAACTSHLDCPGSLICANLGTTAAPAYSCVEGCTEAAECAEATVPGACNATTDSFGEAAQGCFAKSGANPVNFCQ